ncbi:MAG: endonuclease I family protein [Paludibacteraceae bacterium]
MKHFLPFFFFLLIPLLLQAEEMPVGYYDAIDGKQDSVLKSTLGQIIRPHTAIPYGSGAESTWGVFYYSDQDEEGYCMDMYCDSWKKFTSVGAVVSGCNIEHSFAKSWWGGTKNDAYKDCYHLNPSNSTANSSRSNYPLGVPTKDLKDQSVTGSLKVGRATYEGETFYVFEPKDEYKGDFARAYFYMATCYGDELTWRLDNKDVGSKYAMRNDSYLEFRDWEIEVLITWHRQDPVSEKETKRMDAVSDFQHNRNPYIDYPELAEYIWGNKKGTAVNLSELTGESTSLPASITPEHIPTVRKLIRNGQVLIERNSVVYSILGSRIQ